MRSSHLILVMLALAATAAHGQDEAASRRASLERQQQSDAFALELRQSQQKLNAGPFGDGLDALHLEQRHEQERLQQDQRRRIATQDEGRLAIERASQQMAFERQMPTWGPTLAPGPSRWTPTLERPSTKWTPTIQ
jgi:hypothetical protein